MAKEIPLTQGQVAIVDDEDFLVLSQHKWHARWSKSTRSFYAVRNAEINGKRKTILMHRVILGAPTGTEVDHRKTGDTLNNQQSNLRIATGQQNRRNTKRRRNRTIKFKGVSKASKTTYAARIRVNGKNILLGCDPAPEKCARLYDLAALEHFGEFALLNFPREEYVNG
jgi:hypothetical protein